MGQQQPDRLGHCPGEVGHRGVDRNDEVELADHCRRVGEVGEQVIKTPDRQLVERREVASAILRLWSFLWVGFPDQTRPIRGLPMSASRSRQTLARLPGAWRYGTDAGMVSIVVLKVSGRLISGQWTSKCGSLSPRR